MVASLVNICECIHLTSHILLCSVCDRGLCIRLLVKWVHRPVTLMYHVPEAILYYYAFMMKLLGTGVLLLYVVDTSEH